MAQNAFMSTLIKKTGQFTRGNKSKTDEKWGLVLSGGGTKGAYEVGAWKAIRELGINIAGITGTSIGALNSALILQDDYAKMESIYKNIKLSDVMPIGDGIDPEKNVFDPQNMRAIVREYIQQGGLDNTPLRKMLTDNIDVDKIYNSPLDFGIVTYEIDSLTPTRLFKEDIPRDHMIDYLLASANFPIYKAQEVKGKKYIDGGVYDNMPVNLLVERGYTHIISIDVDGIGQTRRVEKYDNVYIKVIRCSNPLGGTFDFNPQRIRNNMTLGYLDTMKAFRQLHGHIYFFRRKAFNDLLMNFNLETIYGLEIAARLYKIDRLHIYRADEFLNLLMEQHRKVEIRYQAAIKNRLVMLNIAEVKKMIDNGLVVAWFEQLLNEQPLFRQTGSLAKMFFDYTMAGAAIIELKNYLG